jgi:DNA-binding NtrC family response regulator
MREVQKRIGIAASGEVTVLIEGETGTGKELVARAIHRFGDRGKGPFAKGAFSGAGSLPQPIRISGKRSRSTVLALSP